MADLKDSLRKQLAFIKTSTDRILSGDLDEAVRLATAVRVIVHHTRTSTSILTQLGCSAPLMLATGTPLGPKAIFGESGLTLIKTESSGTHIEPSFDRIPFKRNVAFNTWWGERIFLIGGRSLTRKQLILAAANKDGGAHVDDLPEDYAMFKDGLWTAYTGTTVAGTDGRKLGEQAAMTIVQIAYEITNSPGIIVLLK